MKLLVNILSIYHMTRSGKENKFEFTLESMTIFDMEDNSMVVVSEVNHQTRLYIFFVFVSKSN